MERSVLRLRLALCLLAVLASGHRAAALMPPLETYAYNDGERQVEVKMPKSWRVEKVDHGLRAKRDPRNDLAGTASLGFYEYDKAPTPDDFLSGALAAWSRQYTRWQVVETRKPADLPRVRLATVSFHQFGFPCRGYVMAVIGKETGTIGFCYAETVTAKQLRLDDLVQQLVAGSYSAYPVRGTAVSDEARQAQAQAVASLYGDCNEDFKYVWNEMAQKKQIDPGFLAFCGTFQPALRKLKTFLSGYLPERPQERVKALQVYCVPTHEFNAYALGQNEKGPGFLVFHAELTRAFAALAQEYTALREQGLDTDTFGERLRNFSTALAQAVLSGQEMPKPDPIDFANTTVLNRYERVFQGMIGLVMAHEMAHYYLHHSLTFNAADTGEKGPQAFAVQQREVAADSSAIQHLQAAADKSPNVWEGGAIHAFGFLATIDNLVEQVKNQGKPEPEWTRDHPYGSTRLTLATAALGEDTFKFRNDPWNQGGGLETGEGGVQVVAGGPVAPAGGEAAVTFTHPQSGVTFGFPPGWVAQFDQESGVVSIRRQGGDNLPLAVYSCGGDYSSPSAITDDIMEEMKKSARGFQILRNDALKSGHPKLKMHLALAKGQFDGGELALVAVGIQSPGWNHGVMLMTPADQLQRDLADFEKIVQGMRYKAD